MGLAGRLKTFIMEPKSGVLVTSHCVSHRKNLADEDTEKEAVGVYQKLFYETVDETNKYLGKNPAITKQCSFPSQLSG